MIESFGNFIDGQWKEAIGRKTFPSLNPADRRDRIGEFAAAEAEDARQAIEAALAALPRWKGLSGFARGEFLRKAADILEQQLETVARAMVRENGKTIAEARGETARGVALLRFYAAEGIRPAGDVIPSSNPRTFIYTTREPLGLVSVITPWNFPVAIPLWKLAPALVYGNTAVFKPASLTPHCAVLLTKIFERAGLPHGVLNLVTGGGRTLGEEMVKNPKVHGVTFTGSNAVGRRIGAWAAERGIKFQLEMGGKNPVIVMPDCDLDQAVLLTLRGAFGYAGQKCTATSRAIVFDQIHDAFVEKLVAKTKALKIGPGTDETTFLPPVVSEEQQRSILEAIDRGKGEARLLYGGSVPAGEDYTHGHYVEPAIFDDVPPDSTLAREEIFGPVLAILRARDWDEAIAIANDASYGLSASLFTRDLNNVLEYAQRIEAGVVKVNSETAGIEPQVPFGGMKDSSSHSREQGRAAMEFYTSIKSVYIDRAGL
jgi:alpha-ketoglutaric semialdehyde dehydrogenase